MSDCYQFPHFDSFEDFIVTLPTEEQRLVKRLRNLLFDMEPRLIETFPYGVPYYKRNRQVCFLWPSSALGGPTSAKLSLGFCHGNFLSNEQGLLLAEGRKQVYILRVSSLKEIDSIETSLKEIIQEALLVDDLEFRKVKKA